MSELFDRYISLEVGKPDSIGRKFDTLKISIDITKDDNSEANVGKISIYNLNEDSKNLILDEASVFTLKAGYIGLDEGSNIGQLATGDIEDVVTKRQGMDNITTFKISEKGKALREKTLDKSFASGISKEAIMNEMVNTLGVVKGTIKGIKDKFFNSGYSASGKVKDQLDTFTKEDGLKWSIQNGELNILPEDESTTEEVVILNYETGLLRAYKEKKEGKDKVFFESLLNPQIKVARKIKIEGKTVNGFFKVSKVNYFGDNKDGKFICKGEVA